MRLFGCAACWAALAGCGQSETGSDATSDGGTDAPGDSTSSDTNAEADVAPSGTEGGADSAARVDGADGSSPAVDSGSGVPQGLYESCPPSDSTCLSRLDAMAGAGFKLVVNYEQEGGNGAQQIAYFDHAHSLGMKVIWSFSDPYFIDGTDLRSQYPALAAGCSCTDNAGFVSYVVNLVKGHPALWGYYVADEPAVADEAAVKAFSNQVRAADPNHPRWIVGNADVTLITPFVNDAEVIGLDIYPIQDQPTSQQSVDEVGQLAQMGQPVATQSGRPWSMVLQAFSWTQYPGAYTPPYGARWPTRDEMRGMRVQALKDSQPAMLLWFGYFLVETSDDPAGHWADLVAAAFGP